MSNTYQWSNLDCSKWPDSAVDFLEKVFDTIQGLEPDDCEPWEQVKKIYPWLESWAATFNDELPYFPGSYIREGKSFYWDDGCSDTNAVAGLVNETARHLALKWTQYAHLNASCVDSKPCEGSSQDIVIFGHKIVYDILPSHILTLLYAMAEHGIQLIKRTDRGSNLRVKSTVLRMLFDACIQHSTSEAYLRHIIVPQVKLVLSRYTDEMTSREIKIMNDVLKALNIPLK